MYAVNKEGFTTYDVPNMTRPFLNLYGVKKDGSEFLVNIVFITYPFTKTEHIGQYNEAKDKGVQFLGLSSYSEYPGEFTNIHDPLYDRNNDAWTKYDYFELTRGWLTCFTEENNKKWIKPGFPRINITESDFCNHEKYVPDITVKKDYDFIYICLKDGDKHEEASDCPQGWQAEIRQWDTVKKLLDIMCERFNLKGLLIGRINCNIPKQCHQLLELTDFMEHDAFIKQYNRCKFILTPSLQDSSPRTCAESMCFDLPVLMNKNILGGWHYINEETGSFYDPDNLGEFQDILGRFLEKIANNQYHPREWFINNYGRYNSGKRLLKFVQEVFTDDELNFKYNDIEYLRPVI